MTVEGLKAGPTRIFHDSHMFGGTILEHDFTGEYEDLMEVLSTAVLPLRDSTPFDKTSRPARPKRQYRKLAGQRKYSMFPVDQRALNEELSLLLRRRGWKAEPIAGTEAATATLAGPGLKGDFVKNDVFVEVEFGNVASMHRDLFKFHIANRSQQGQVGVLVTATNRLARFFDQGVTTFEAAVATKPYMSIGIQMPLWLVGIEPSDWGTIQAKYEEMQRVCEENNLDCHDFATVFGAPLDPAEEIPP